jgi:hypothetical protein
MKLNLQRLEELKRELHTDGTPDYENQEPLGLQVIMDAVRQYVYNETNDVITKLLTDYGVLVNETEEENPIVKPFKFTTNG